MIGNIYPLITCGFECVEKLDKESRARTPIKQTVTEVIHMSEDLIESKCLFCTLSLLVIAIIAAAGSWNDTSTSLTRWTSKHGQQLFLFFY